MNKLIFHLLFICFYLIQLSPFAGAQVFVNQAGYLPDLQKIFYTSSAADSFYLVETSSGQIAFRGELYFSLSNDPATNLTLYAGDFSSFTSNGNYFIKINGADSSYSFQISPTVYDDVYKKSLKGYYFQRCGISLLQPYAGVYYHSACHPGDGFYHSSTGQSGFRLTTGGWHDAGDYGKYVVNSGITVGTLLQAFESYPEKFNQDNLNIPESGNGIPDLLDEVRYEIEWLLKMQNENGGVYFKVTKEQFEPFIMPQNDSGIRYIYTLSSTATGDFAAIMSKAARIYQTIDTSFSNRCLNAAVLAWNFLINNPTIIPVGGFKNPTGTATGEYGDTNDSDERLWAASELFETTGLSEYSTYFISNFATGGIISSSMSWNRVKNLALLTYLNSSQSGSSQTVKNQIKNSLISYANTLIGRSSINGFGIAINPGEYYWGCNSDVINKALMLIYAYEQTNNNLYVQTALTQINYILGTNAHNFSFLTGVGSNSVMHPHHRPSVADGVVNPVPGLLAGGPDQYLDDPVLQAHFSGNTPPALCYIDDVGSYASNEIAINWNAPLVFVSGYFNGGSVNSADDQGVNFVPDRFDLKQNFPNPFNPSTTITWQAAVSSWQTIKVYDVLGNEVSKLVDEFRNAGSYAVNFNASQLASGIYFYKLQAGDFVQTKKMSLIK
ncbi:MAG: glycoside hydrolase family 9 protein [Ignavibacterium sp.]|nr:glycoside hydrolase family 9 protein [Ignavibacterium sp.]